MRFRPFAIMVMLLAAAVQPVVAQSQELIVPIVVTGTVKSPRHFQTILRFVNLSPGARMATVRVYDDTGTPIWFGIVFCVIGPPTGPPAILPGGELPLQMPGNGAGELSSLGNRELFTGWASLRFEGAPAIQTSAEIALIDAPSWLCFQPICPRPSTEIFTSVQSAAVAAAREFSAAASITDKRESAYALVNPSATQTATVELVAFDVSGRIVDQNTLKVPPLGRISKFLFELLNLGKVFFQAAQRPAFYHGSVRFRSDIPIAVGGLNVLSPEGKLVNLPTIPVP